MKFRSDVNALRALALMGVVLYHFFPDILPGGFAGVDVFFVISGYLMTTIIVTKIEDGKFSLLTFYRDRCRRILPALVVLASLVSVLCFFILTPVEFYSLIKHVVSSLFFISNFTYWSESGYFDVASHSKWLLHTWSLSTEWQFYLLYPIFLLLLSKALSFNIIKKVVFLGTFISFALCVYASYKWPSPSYYLLPTRVWEMTLGSLAFFYPIHNSTINYRKYFSILGFLLIFSSYILISSEYLWPGYLALVPSIGAFLVINFHGASGRIVNNKFVNIIGVDSYSIYLWHWPLVVLVYYFSLPIYFSLCLFLFSFLLGRISSKYFERLSFISVVSMYALILSFFIFLSVWGGKLYNIPSKLWTALIVDVKDERHGEFTWKGIKSKSNVDRFESIDKEKVLIIGDSQAGDFFNAISESSAHNEREYASLIIPAKCGFFYLSDDQIEKFLQHDTNGYSAGFLKLKCTEIISKIKNSELLRSADTIFIAMNWNVQLFPYIDMSFKNLYESIERNTDVYVVGNKAFNENISILMYDYLNSDRNSSLGSYIYGKIPEANHTVNEKLSSSIYKYDFRFIDIMSIICNDEKCNILDSYDMPIYYDNVHTTISGAKVIGKNINY